MKKNSDSKHEQRTYSGEVQVRSEGENTGRTIEGYAALYNVRSENMGGMYEILAPGAFDNADMSDVRALFNHDASGILARTASGTLELFTDEKGLKYRFEAPNTNLGNDLLEMIKRRDVSQSSFAFSFPTEGDDWFSVDKENRTFTINKIDRVYDVSPVTYPAYSMTSVAARSLEQALEEKQEKPNDYESRTRHLDVLRRQNQ